MKTMRATFLCWLSVLLLVGFTVSAPSARPAVASAAVSDSAGFSAEAPAGWAYPLSGMRPLRGIQSLHDTQPLHRSVYPPAKAQSPFLRSDTNKYADRLLEIGGRLRRLATSKKHWVWPVDWPQKVTRGFNPPGSGVKPYAAGYHRGADLAAQPEAKVYAPEKGVIKFVGWVVNRYVLTIDHGDNLLSSFEPVDTHLRQGQTVRRGQYIGNIVEDGHNGSGAKGLIGKGIRKAGELAGKSLGTAVAGPVGGKIGKAAAKLAVNAALVNAGMSGGLHVGVRKNGLYVNPLLFFGKIESSVLLPRT